MTGCCENEFWFQEHLAVCHLWRWQKSCRSCMTVKGGWWTEPAGWSLWIWKSLLFGLPPCPHCPCPPDQLYSADSSLVGNRGEAAESSLTKHVAKAPTVLILIIDQMIKADEEIFFFFESESCDCASLTCLERAAKRSILSIRPESSSVSHAE